MAAAIASPPVKFVEVPIVGSDSVQWIGVSVPSFSVLPAEPCAPRTENAAGSSIVGDHPVYIIWRIHKDTPNYVELLELCASNELPKNGLRLMFKHALCPFAFIYKNKKQNDIGNGYIYIFTVSGLAYIVRLRSLSAYVSGSVLPETDFLEVDLRAQCSQVIEITSLTGLPGIMAVGRNDGSVSCFEFEETASISTSQESVYELRDAGLSRLWGYVSRANIYSAVISLEVSKIHGRKVLYVLHADGSLRVWDLSSRVKIFSQIISPPEFARYNPMRLCVGDVEKDAGDIFVATTHINELGQEVIVVHALGICFGDKFSLIPKSPVIHVPLGEGKLIDLRMSSHKLWVLKQDTPMLFSSFLVELDGGSTLSCSLQDAFVADQLFQGSEDSVDDLIYVNYSITSSLKGPSVPFVSSLFLRKLLQPGIFQHAALGASFRHHKHHIMDYEIESLSSGDLRKRILSVIEGEEDCTNPFSIVGNWKSFCNNYLQNWCQSSIPYGLLSGGSAEIVGLIRRNSVSLFRCLEDREAYAYGSFDKYNDYVNSGLNLLDDDVDCEILSKILKSVGCISQRLGRAAAPALYESLANPRNISSDDVICCLLKILETGYDLPTTEHYISAFGVDSIIDRKHAEHRKQRKFSVSLLLDLSALHVKIGSWRKILDVIDKYVERLVPGSMDASGIVANKLFNINTSLLVFSLSQFARVMFESACDLLLLLRHTSNIQGQIHMSFDDSSRVQLELIPKLQGILLRWFIVHMLATSPCLPPALDDFNYKLSSLQIDTKHGKRIRCDKLGTYSSTLCSILLLEYPNDLEDHTNLTSRLFLAPSKFPELLQKFVSWILSSRATGDESLFSLNHVIRLSMILVLRNQYEAVENLIFTVGAHSHKKKVPESTQSGGGDWSVCLYLLGFCLLLGAHCSPNRSLKEIKFREATRCFFRAGEGEGAYQAFQKLSFPPNLQCPGASYEALWKLNYYQWMMQVFEQYNVIDAACEFALVALERVDEVHWENELGHGVASESATNIRGRLWANVFKFNLDTGHYSDAYSAIISNPDEESKLICLRRFIIVLCEHGETKLLCGGELPFVGLMDKLEQELFWKAECSDTGCKPNIYKLLYAIQMHHHNWRRAANYMYRYAVRLKNERSSKDHLKPTVSLEESLQAIAVTINALHLVHPAYCWIDAHQETYMHLEQCSPNKKARKSANESSDRDWQFQEKQFFIDVDELEKEYIVTSAEYLLTLANVKLTYAEFAFRRSQSDLQSIVDLLVQTNLYDMAFTVILKFWKGSTMKRELEKVFVVMAQNCCWTRGGTPASHLLLTHSKERSELSTVPDMSIVSYNPGSQSHWKTLEFYLEKYKELHSRLPVTVADALLRTDPHIELPLWLVHMFKDGRKPASWGMTGSESDQATLFRLFVCYGRYKDATSLLLEYLELFASSRTTKILNCKKMSAVWFPYVSIERLWCDLEELKASGHMVDQCDKLLKQLHAALLGHLKQVKVDSEDAFSCGMVNNSEV